MRTLIEFVNWVYGDTDAMYYKIKEKKGKEKMKEPKFKVGDKVIIKDGSKMKNYRGGWIKAMNECVGKVCTISFVANPTEFCDTFGYRMKEIDFTWDERGLEQSESTIIISKEGNKVTATCNGFSGIARCNPEDDFDFKTGVNLAIERLFEKKDRIKEGDSVIVTDPGKCYTTYSDWVVENIKDKKMIARYRYHEDAKKGEIYSVIKITTHGIWCDCDLAFISNTSGCYLINVEGLKKA